MMVCLTCLTVYAAPQRVVSLNLCADQLLLDLLPAHRIAGLTNLSTDPDLSYHHQKARQFPHHRGDFESILALQPDLIVAGRYTTSSTTQLLESMGYPVLKLDVPSNLEQMYQQIQTLGDALEESARASMLIQQTQQRLIELQPPVYEPKPVAVVYYANGMSMGRASVIHELLANAGFENLAARLGMDDYRALPLEVLIREQPDVIILGNHNSDRRSMAQQILSHPALLAYQAQTKQSTNLVTIPDRYWLCAGPSVVDAAQALASTHASFAHVKH